MNPSESMRVSLVLFFGSIFACGFLGADSLNDTTITELEVKRESIQAELEELAILSLRTGSLGTSGYRSFPQDTPEIEGEWLQIDFEQAVTIDEIVLVPTLWRYGDEEGYRSDGFPEAFSIISGMEGDRKGEVIAEFDASDSLLPRVAPVVISVSGVQASWIRIEPTILTQRERDRKYIFQLSEVLVFSGEENVALHQPVSFASDVPLNSGIWKPDRIVDGGMPYLMDSAQGGEKSAHFQELRINPYLTLDLQEEQWISTIHLHAAYQSKSAPPEFNVNRGIPTVLLIEGGLQPDFSDATLLLKHTFRDIGEFAPILMWNIPRTNCRYIRITGDSTAVKEGNFSTYQGSNQLGFAEIEFLSAGRNVAYQKGPIEVSGQRASTLYKLTDGYNIYGSILPIRSWMNQLAMRHDLERELEKVVGRLDYRYQKQQATLSQLKRLTIVLIVVVALTLLIGRHLRMREAARIRERFTADLHDHVGASLHALGILSSHTKDIVDSPDRLEKALDEIGVMTKRASEATRDFCSQQAAKEVHENLMADLKRTAGRMIANLSYSFTVEGEEFLQQLKPRVRSDFFLFFKECLININRHADATEVKIQLKADSKEVHLKIADNGHGISESEEVGVPPSLARRARYLGSKVLIVTSERGGTSISMKLGTRRANFLNLLRLEK